MGALGLKGRLTLQLSSYDILITEEFRDHIEKKKEEERRECAL